MKRKFTTPAGVRNGDVFFFKGTAWYSRAIRYHTQSIYSHVGIAYQLPVNGRRLCIFESCVNSGVRLYPMDVYLRDCARGKVDIDWYRLDDGQVCRDRMAELCWDAWAKTKYASYVQLSWSFGVLSWARRLLGMKADLEGGKFCSFVAAEILQGAGYKPNAHDVSDPALTSPGDVSRYTCLRNMGPLECVMH